MEGVNLIVMRGVNGNDITGLVESIHWKGRKGSAARSIEASLLDDDGYNHARIKIAVEEGLYCIFSFYGKELFRGIIMTVKQKQDKKMSFTAYDNGIYLANNQDTFCYTNKTAADIFKDCCNRFKMPYSEAAATSYVIPELTKPKTTAWDTIADALSLDFKATGIRHFVISEKGSLKLLTRRENIMQWVIESGVNLVSYSYSNSIEKIKTRIKIVSKEGAAIAEKNKSALEEKIGIFQAVEKPNETLSTTQLQNLATTILDEQSMPEKNLELEAIGIPDVISGIGVFVIIQHLGLSRAFYVDDDTHTFTDRNHMMKLKLNFANDLGIETSGQKSTNEDYSVGDIVNFNGGCHYVSSNANSPTGGTRKSGKAKITLIAKGAKHPYHLIGGAFSGIEGNCNVYGWVDEGTFSK